MTALKLNNSTTVSDFTSDGHLKSRHDTTTVSSGDPHGEEQSPEPVGGLTRFAMDTDTSTLPKKVH
jgi:hypothetical protein